MIFCWTGINGFKFFGNDWRFGGSASSAGAASGLLNSQNYYLRLCLMAQ